MFIRALFNALTKGYYHSLATGFRITLQYSWPVTITPLLLQIGTIDSFASREGILLASLHYEQFT